MIRAFLFSVLIVLFAGSGLAQVSSQVPACPDKSRAITGSTKIFSARSLQVRLWLLNSPAS